MRETATKPALYLPRETPNGKTSPVKMHTPSQGCNLE